MPAPGCPEQRPRTLAMKRHDTLQDLSREHHTALKLALDARRAATSGDAERVATAAATCTRVFAAALEPHFRSEESGLLPAMLAGEEALVARTLREHAELRALVGRLPDADATTLLSFADLLSAHVRFEERELFAAAQLRLDQQD
ncbi:MAG: hemerythrin HHE cation binding domain-containing protein [Candidatus Accumulibacter regalis]|jgi:hemerythrin-like domain-containing protein